MTRFSAALAVLVLAAFPLLAATADLQVTLTAPTSILAGNVMHVRGSVTNAGPDPVFDLHIIAGAAGYPSCFDGDLGWVLNAGNSVGVECDFVPLYPPLNVKPFITASSHTTNDPNPSDNRVEASVDILLQPDLYVFVSTLPYIDPELPFQVLAGFTNRSDVPAHDVTLVVSIPGVAGFENLPPNCQAEGSTATCTYPVVNGPERGRPVTWTYLALTAIAPADQSTILEPVITATLRELDPTLPNRSATKTELMWTFYATNTADSGAGSLRSAILDANEHCVDAYPCKVAFRIPIAEDEDWVTIRPQTALPRITATAIQIDGTTQTRFMGDTNILGPEVEISGARVAESANGIEVANPCMSVVSGLAINGWNGNGVQATTPTSPLCTSNLGYYYGRVITKNYIGTDPTGTAAIPNLRGIGVDPGLNYSNHLIQDNVISGNRLSGIYLNGKSGDISGNTIGLNALRSGPLGNGASGIYVGPRASGLNVRDNHIAFNRHAGISIAREATLVEVSGNSIHANQSIAIDYALDGVTDGVPADFGATIRSPRIDTVRYDAATNTTRVEGELPDGLPHGGWFDVNVYANDAPDPSGFGEGQYYLGHTELLKVGPFSFSYTGDLRGKWVTATATRRYYNGFAKPPLLQSDGDAQGFLTTTSEFGRCVEVK
jgi:hypothetical protein